MSALNLKPYNEKRHLLSKNNIRKSLKNPQIPEKVNSDEKFNITYCNLRMVSNKLCGFIDVLGRFNLKLPNEILIFQKNKLLNNDKNILKNAYEKTVKIIYEITKTEFDRLQKIKNSSKNAYHENEILRIEEFKRIHENDIKNFQFCIFNYPVF